MSESDTPLEAQILQRSKEIATDAYSMSIGEFISLYNNEEVDIHPEFQRFFRWSSTQKSRFIESILLGIPIPSIFVAQRSDGVWDLIDGLQRVSTILQLTGDLKDEDDKQVDPLVLERTPYLPTLEHMKWTQPEEAKDLELPQSAKLRIRRAKIDLKIVLSSSDPSAKYELFQRLNTGGSIATDQEVRNCLLIMINGDMYKFVCTLADQANFREMILLSERAEQERFDLELIVRFLVLRKLQEVELRAIADLGQFLTDRIQLSAEKRDIDYEQERSAFVKTMDYLYAALGEDAFKKYDPVKERSLGGFLISVFEVLALGVGYRADSQDYTVDADLIRNVHQSLWKNADFRRRTGSGVRASQRIPFTIPLGRQQFGP
jgi:hypothetical protein